MAVFKDCHQRLPKVLLKWWPSLKIVIKDCLKFCWSDGCLSRLSSKTAQSSAEVMAVFKDCHQRLPKVLLKWWLSLKIVFKRLPKVLLKWWLSWKAGEKTREKTASLQRLEKRTREKTAEKDCRDRTCGFDNPLVTSCVSGAPNCVKMQILHFADRPFRHCMRVGRAERPFRHFVRVGRSKLW